MCIWIHVCIYTHINYNAITINYLHLYVNILYLYIVISIYKLYISIHINIYTYIYQYTHKYLYIYVLSNWDVIFVLGRLLVLPPSLWDTEKAPSLLFGQPRSRGGVGDFKTSASCRPLGHLCMERHRQQMALPTQLWARATGLTSAISIFPSEFLSYFCMNSFIFSPKLSLFDI